MKAYTIYTAPEYDEWLRKQPFKSQVQIRERIFHIEDEGHFGDRKAVGAGVWELRWKNGRRVHYAYIPEQNVLLILGGNKNGQDKDIHQAKKILAQCATYTGAMRSKAQKRRQHSKD